ncbi:cadherin-like beta sandwich domain-containing protein, partial [Chitinimonas sp.]|uniref:cadherin-like beta sandwich domain-containing protein n=1 Tax=Chitinimonas sp. TaxID=1934313 RepID=UPI002F95E691
GTDSTNSSGSTASTDASLSALVLSSGSLSPSFVAATTSYSASVTNGASSITVIPTASSATATIKVNGTAVASGSASAAISLAVGSNSLIVLVTAADGTTTRSYTLTVVRAAASAAGNCALIPSETEGPYPLLAILSNSAIVRQDIREAKTGVPLTLNLTLENVNNLCAPISNAAVYIWHCDKDGEYSGYSSSQNGNHAGETYLRGIQVSDSAGQVSFSTIYPGWYMGRATHIHAQVYLNDNLKVTATVTTQFAFPEATNATVYASTLYAAHGQNTSVPSNAGDNVFSDGTTYQMLTLSGDVSSGFVATLHLGIAA